MIKIAFSYIFMTSLLVVSSCNKQRSEYTSSERNGITVSMTSDPNAMDPRRGRSLGFAGFMHLLFEGLMRPDVSGKLVPGTAESYTFTNDLKTYTFKLRDAHWSNGDPVTSHDFAYAIKSSLQPDFPAPNAYQFFDIVGAKEAKEGKRSIDEIGIETPDEKTLVIHLKQPHPYFLELTAFHAYYPVKEKWDKAHAAWSDGPAENVISNGPYRLKKWAHNDSVTLEKNPHYWDAPNVAISDLEFVQLEDNTAMQLYEQGQLDWVGSPLSTIPPDAIATLRSRGELLVSPAAGTFWLRFNTGKSPLSNVNIRRALSYAINRQGMVEHITQGNQTPANGIVPPSMADYHEPYFEDHDTISARELFQEGLEELHLSIDDFPKICLVYGNDERSHKIAQAIQQDWQKTFPVKPYTFALQSNESKVLGQRVSTQDYQVALGSWFGDFRDPINFLEVFKTKTNGTNNTLWENTEYTALLDKSSTERDPYARKQILASAEKLLISEMPIAPLFHGSYNYLKKDTIQGVYFSDLGYLDFKHAYFGTEPVGLNEVFE